MTELNLIPFQIREAKVKTKKIKQAIALTAAACLLFSVICIYLPELFLVKVKEQASILNNKIQSLSYVRLENKQALQTIDEYKNYIDKIEGIKKQKIFVEDRIRSIESSVPSDIVFTDINYSDNSLVLEGEADIYNSIPILAANLQMTKKYKDAKVTDIKYDEAVKKYTFTANINF